MTGYSEKRKKLLINPPFQLRFIAYLVVATLISISAFYLINVLFLNRLVTEAASLGLNKDHPYFLMVQSQQKDLHILFGIVGAHVVLLLTLTGLYISHKVAGPLEKMKRYLEAHTRGEHLPPLQFRRGDFFQEIPDVINKFIKR